MRLSKEDSIYCAMHYQLLVNPALGENSQAFGLHGEYMYEESFLEFSEKLEEDFNKAISRHRLYAMFWLYILISSVVGFFYITAIKPMAENRYVALPTKADFLEKQTQIILEAQKVQQFQPYVQYAIILVLIIGSFNMYKNSVAAQSKMEVNLLSLKGFRYITLFSNTTKEEKMHLQTLLSIIYRQEPKLDNPLTGHPIQAITQLMKPKKK